MARAVILRVNVFLLWRLAHSEKIRPTKDAEIYYTVAPEISCIFGSCFPIFSCS